MIRTESKPIVFGLRTFDYYYEQVFVRVIKLVQLLRLVVVKKLVVDTIVVVVIVKLLIGWRLLLRRWRWFAANPMSSWYTIFFSFTAIRCPVTTALGGEDSRSLCVQPIIVQSQHWERAVITYYYNLRKECATFFSLHYYTHYLLILLFSMLRSGISCCTCRRLGNFFSLDVLIK